jgi:hypothetical protein
VHRPALRTGASDARLADLAHSLPIVEGALESVQFLLGVSRGLHLLLDQLGLLASKPVQLDHEASDVPELKLPQLS